MIPGTVPWVVRSVRDWALAVRQGLALVTYRSGDARLHAVELLTSAFQENECKTETLHCANCTAEEFLDQVANSHADVLFVLDLDRLLFGENDDRSPFWINFHRETIVGHSGVQIWWMLPNAAVRFGQQLPDLSRFFLFREELRDQDEIQHNGERIRPPQPGVGPGDANWATDLLGRAVHAAGDSRVDPGRIWLELGIPAMSAFLRDGQTLQAAGALQRLTATIGAPEKALGPLSKTAESPVGWAFLALGHVYHALGRWEEARAATDEAVRIYRCVANNNPALLSGLAGALTNLANRFTDLGDPEQALIQADEAVRILRELAAQNPDFLFQLAGSLNNLALALTNLGRLEEALARQEEAVRICRQSTSVNPEALLPTLGSFLGNLSNTLSNLGRAEEALKAAQEAAQVYTRLARGSNNDVFLPGLAVALDNLANRLGNLGYLEEALTQAQEALFLRRQLAHQDPDGFRADLARSLSNTANKLSRLNRPHEALPLVEESVNIQRNLANIRPDAFLPSLALSLHNLANTLGMLNRGSEAIEFFAEAIRLLLPLYHRHPRSLGSLLDTVRASYLQTARHAGIPPDPILLA